LLFKEGINKMKLRFILFGHEFRICPIDSYKLHVTDYIKDVIEEKPWELTFPIEKRVNAMVGDEEHKFIDYVFRNYGEAVLVFRETALLDLEDIMKYRVRKIRKILESKGATSEMLKQYDNKVHKCFAKVVKVVEDKAMNPCNKNQKEDMELLMKLKSYAIYQYHEGEIGEKL
jgi:hypothetical protein